MEKRIALLKGNRKPDEIVELNLDKCHSSRIIGLTNEFTGLQSLSLINVGLMTLKGFPQLPKLRKLQLSDNRLEDGFHYLHTSPNLEYLHLSGNQIKELDVFKQLQFFKKLHVLDAFGNEAAKHDDYRQIVFGMLPSLRLLDGLDCNDAEATEEEEEVLNLLDGSDADDEGDNDTIPIGDEGDDEGDDGYADHDSDQDYNQDENRDEVEVEDEDEDEGLGDINHFDINDNVMQVINVYNQPNADNPDDVDHVDVNKFVKNTTTTNPPDNANANSKENSENSDSYDSENIYSLAYVKAEISWRQFINDNFADAQANVDYSDVEMLSDSGINEDDGNSQPTTVNTNLRGRKRKYDEDFY